MHCRGSATERSGSAPATATWRPSSSTSRDPCYTRQRGPDRIRPPDKPAGAKQWGRRRLYAQEHRVWRTEAPVVVAPGVNWPVQMTVGVSAAELPALAVPVATEQRPADLQSIGGEAVKDAEGKQPTTGIGAPRFELGISATQRPRGTRLRHAPSRGSYPQDRRTQSITPEGARRSVWYTSSWTPYFDRQVRPFSWPLLLFQSSARPRLTDRRNTGCRSAALSRCPPPQDSRADRGGLRLDPSPRDRYDVDVAFALVLPHRSGRAQR